MLPLTSLAPSILALTCPDTKGGQLAHARSWGSRLKGAQLGDAASSTLPHSPVRHPAHSSTSPAPSQRATCPLQLGWDFILGLINPGSFDRLPTADVHLLID